MGTANVYYNGILLGTGTVLAAGTTITGYTANNNGGLASDPARRCGHNKPVHVVTSGLATSNGVYRSRVVKDTTVLAAADIAFGTSLIMAKACPFA